jgi:hypothetical protein
MKLSQVRLRESVTLDGVSESSFGAKPTHANIELELDEATGLVWIRSSSGVTIGVHVSACREIRAAKRNTKAETTADVEQATAGAQPRGRRPAKLLEEPT